MSKFGRVRLPSTASSSSTKQELQGNAQQKSTALPNGPKAFYYQLSWPVPYPVTTRFAVSLKDLADNGRSSTPQYTVLSLTYYCLFHARHTVAHFIDVQQLRHRNRDLSACL